MSNPNSKIPKTGQTPLLNIYDRLASLGRAMQRAANASKESQGKHSVATANHPDKTEMRKQRKSRVVTG